MKPFRCFEHMVHINEMDLFFVHFFTDESSDDRKDGSEINQKWSVLWHLESKAALSYNSYPSVGTSSSDVQQLETNRKIRGQLTYY